MDCPHCGEPDMLYHPAEDDDEVAMFQCPECTHEERA